MVSIRKANLLNGKVFLILGKVQYRYHGIRRLFSINIKSSINYNNCMGLDEELANVELERATLIAEMQSFQSLYLETVGGLIAELDEVEALIAEALARSQPANQKSNTTAQRSRERAEESAQSYESYRSENQDSPTPKKFTPTHELKELFREVAKKIHPDFAKDEKDRLIREELMKRANEAYQKADVQLLQKILEEYESSPESITGDSVGAELVRLIRTIELVNRRIEQIREEIKVLSQSELATLKGKYDSAKKQGRDLLGEMESALSAKIKQRKIELSGAVQKGTR